MKNQEEFQGEITYYYLCRKCGKSIKAWTPDGSNTAKMVEVKKHTYEFECWQECGSTD